MVIEVDSGFMLDNDVFLKKAYGWTKVLAQEAADLIDTQYIEGRAEWVDEAWHEGYEAGFKEADWL